MCVCVCLRTHVFPLFFLTTKCELFFKILPFFPSLCVCMYVCVLWQCTAQSHNTTTTTTTTTEEGTKVKFFSLSFSFLTKKKVDVEKTKNF